MSTIVTISSTGWRVELERDWDVLGPFPTHAREQHFLSPAYPLDLSSPILTTTQPSIYPTSLTHTAYASWSRTTADLHGTIVVSHPSVPWEQIRATEGWAGIQHMNVVRGWLSVHPPSRREEGRDTGDGSVDESEPLLRADLLQGAFFTILPPPDSPQRKTNYVPEWHPGNVYAMERAPAQFIRFPVSPARNGKGTRYEVIICGAYEIRLFGDPNVYSSPYPILTLNFSVALEFPCAPAPLFQTTRTQISVESSPIQHIPTHSITPHIVDGTPFGEAIGIGMRCLDFAHWAAAGFAQSSWANHDNTGTTKLDFGDDEGQRYWSIVSARLNPGLKPLPPSLSLALLDGMPIRIAPTQMRVIPLRLLISSFERIPEDVVELDVELTCVSSSSMSFLEPTAELPMAHSPTSVHPVAQETFILRTSLPLTHIPLWTETEHIPIRATYFFAGSMVTAFSVKPPRKAFGEVICGQDDWSDTRKRCRGNEPILALHGAGVDILTQSFWADSLMRQKYAWVVIPQGRTAWGLDWHGPSTADAFTAVSALSHILSTSGLGRWKEWGFDPGTRVVLMGHSNGGQGAWYMASRWPDRVCAVIPAAGYIKSQAYVSWCMSRFAHFVDPALRAVLDSSLTPDDNDLFLGNLVGMPVLAIHGGADDNVPPWHTREQVGTLKTWRSGADVTYHEDPGQPHWYFDILFNKHVQIFLDRVYFPPSPPVSAPPASIGGVPDRKHVYTEAANSQEGETKSFTLTVAVPAESGSMDGWQICALNVPGLLARLQVVKPPNGHTSIRTTNISAFSLDLNIWFTVCGELVGLENTTTALTVDGEDIRVDVGGMGYSDSTILFMRDVKMYKPSAGLRCKPTWKIRLCPNQLVHVPHIPVPLQPSQRLQAILSTHAPLTLLVPTLAPSPELSAALRIAHALQLFHSLDTQIVSVREVAKAGGDVGSGNLVVIGCAEESLVQGWLERMRSIWTYRDGAWRIDERKFERPSSAILFLQQHPYNLRAISLFLQSTDTSGLERAVRLFPIRTGVLSPDWLVVDGRADKIGAAAVEGAGVYGWTLDDDQHTSTMPGKWIWNERMSWID